MIIAKGQDGNKFIITLAIDTEYLKELRMEEVIRIEDFMDEELKELVIRALQN